MLLTISTTHSPARDLGFLLCKHPDRLQSFDLSFGQAHVFYPRADDDVCTACLLLDVDTVDTVRGKTRDQRFLLGHYVNDRPYVASSFLSVAIAQVFGSALAGRCREREALAAAAIPLSATIDVLPVRGSEDFARRIFEPLGYTVEAVRQPLDEQFPEWGPSPYYSITLTATRPLWELLTHLYVLAPVFDNGKHYFIGDDELEKLLAKGAGWLAAHPEKEQITRRYLGHRAGLYREALAQLIDEEPDVEDEAPREAQREAALERPLSLNDERHGTVLATLRASGARSVLDLGCGEGKLLRELLSDRSFQRIVGLDVSVQALQQAVRRLHYDRLPPTQRERIELIHGSLMYRDRRLTGFDAAAVVEVVEHLDPPRLSAFERVLFEFAQPKTVVLTTPNREYNVVWDTLPAGQFRHSDHRFEWTRAEFQGWAGNIAHRYGYAVRFVGIGSAVATVGPPTQMAVFERS
jgi:3' terminal RNA ribose 2'-O-methyltransferase Hen1